MHKWPMQLAALVAILFGAFAALVYAVLHAQSSAARASGPEIVRSEPLAAQQFVYAEQVTLANGERAAIFVPNHPLSIAVQVRSGSRVMVLGDVVSCRPFTETEAIGDRKASQQMLNCGPLSRGGEDRILAVVGLRW